MPLKRIEEPQANRTSIIPGLVGMVAVIFLAIGLALEHQTRLELRKEQQALKQQLDRVTELLAENERQASLVGTADPAPLASDSSNDLLRLRAEVGVLRQLTNELERARNENTDAHAALDHYLASEAATKVATADFWPRDSWSFAGFASPDDALRSSLWAANNGDLKAMFDSMTGELRQEMEKEFGGKAADEAAIQAMDEVSRFKSIQVLNRDFQGSDTAVLTAVFEDRDQPHTAKLLLKKVGNEWKLAAKDDN